MPEFPLISDADLAVLPTARGLVRDASGETYSLMDVNRSGVPLMEIVGDPDLRTPDEAGAYLRALRQVLRYLGVDSDPVNHGWLCDRGRFNLDSQKSDERVLQPLVRSGELPGIKIGGRGQWRVESTALEDFIAQQYRQTAEFVRLHPFGDE